MRVVSREPRLGEARRHRGLGMRLNLGCGAQVVDGWLNVDYAIGARLAKMPVLGRISKGLRLTRLDWDGRIFIHDLRKRLPWADGSVEAIYSSHTLEHLDKEHGRKLVQECQRVLKPGGVLRIVVPDLRAIVTDYVEGRLPADDFLGVLEVLPQASRGVVRKRLAGFFQFDHRCMYDTKRLVELLEETGFTAAVREPYNSDINGIELLELEDRTLRAAIVEGRKRG